MSRAANLAIFAANPPTVNSTMALFASNVGINNTTPSDMLSVNGSVQFTNSSATAVFYAAANGNIGIGLNSPYQKLTISSSVSGAGISWGDSTSNYNNIFASYSGGALVLATNIQGNTSSDAYTSSYGGSSVYRNAIRLDNVQGTGIQFFTDSSSTVARGTAVTPTERMRIDSTGKVGIGVSSINSTYLQLGSAGQYSSSLAVRQSRNSIEWGHPNQNGYGSVLGAEEPSGHSFIAFNAGNGTNPNTYKTWGMNGFVIKNDLSAPALTFNYLATTSADNQSLTERMRIDSSGKVGIGTASPTSDAKATVYNSAASTFVLNLVNANTSGYGLSIGTDSTNLAYFYSNSNRQTICGSISCATFSTAYNTSSDYRLKENVQPMTTGLATIGALNPVTYDWINDKSQGEGFIAHELQEVIPLAVTGEKDAVNEDGTINPQGVDYSKIVVHLVAAIQELTAEVTALKAKVNA